MSAESVLQLEAAIRLGCFLAVFLSVWGWETAAPRRARTARHWFRWGNNLAVAVVNGLCLRLLFPLIATTFAVYANARGWGLLPLLGLPGWLAGVIAFLLLDLAIYGQHVVFHAVPAFWRLHRMHHTDPGFDLTTALRFHPLEIVLSMGFKLLLVALLGPPAIAVLIFEIMLNATAMFNHANAYLPPPVDRWVRLLLVTPDMHRVHHSVYRDETDSNFGFNLPWWDRVFGTYRGQPRGGHENMRIGIDGFCAPRDVWLDKLLLQPLRDMPTDTAGRRKRE